MQLGGSFYILCVQEKTILDALSVHKSISNSCQLGFFIEYSAAFIAVFLCTVFVYSNSQFCIIKCSTECACLLAEACRVVFFEVISEVETFFLRLSSLTSW